MSSRETGFATAFPGSKSERKRPPSSTGTSPSSTSALLPPCQSVIVNADDLGYSGWTDDGIFRAFQDGLVSSASLLINGASAALAAKRARTQGLCVGLHLNLTEGTPLSPLDSIPLLLSPDGKLLYKDAFWSAAASAHEEAMLNTSFSSEQQQQQTSFQDQVVLETQAQLARFRELTGVPAKHVDGHQHVHIAPGIAVLLAPLFQSEGVLSTRIPDENTAALTWIEPVRRHRWSGRVAAAKYSRKIYAAHGVLAADRFLGQGFSGSYMSRDRVLASLRRQLPLYDAGAYRPPRRKGGHGRFCREGEDFELSSPPFSSSSSSSSLSSSSPSSSSLAAAVASSSSASSIPTSAEIMVHPGGGPPGETYTRSALPAGCGDGIVDAFNISPDRQHECVVLCDPELRAQLSDAEHRVQLISWDDFHKILACKSPPSPLTGGVRQRLHVLVLAMGMPATGNHVTARRIRRALAEKCGFVVTMVNTDTATSESIHETCTRNSIDVVVGLHAYHAGRLLFPQQQEEDEGGGRAMGASAVGTPCSFAPVVLVAGGTDLNGHGSHGSTAMLQKTDRQRVIAHSLQAADAVVLFNPALYSRAKEMLGNPVMSGNAANHAPFSTMTSTSPTHDDESKHTHTEMFSDVPPPHYHRLVVIPQAVDISGVAGQWLRTRLGIAPTDLLLLLPSGIRPVKDPLFLVSEYLSWHQSVAETRGFAELGDRGKGQDELPSPPVSAPRSSWFVIIGGARDDATLAAVHKNMPDTMDGSGARGGAGGLVYLPPVSHGALLAAISEADVVLNSSRTEGQCGAILEAMALGTPVLARRNEGNCDLIGDCEDRGGLFTTAQECFQSIESGWYGDYRVTDCLLGNAHHAPTPSPLVQARVAAAAQFVKEKHGFDHEASSYCEILLRVVAGRDV
jgi:predicted glycoside hydrolase/deacetylase ChbG (UPF0249 family)